MNSRRIRTSRGADQRSTPLSSSPLQPEHSVNSQQRLRPLVWSQAKHEGHAATPSVFPHLRPPTKQAGRRQLPTTRFVLLNYLRPSEALACHSYAGLVSRPQHGHARTGEPVNTDASKAASADDVRDAIDQTQQHLTRLSASSLRGIAPPRKQAREERPSTPPRSTVHGGCSTRRP